MSPSHSFRLPRPRVVCLALLAAVLAACSSSSASTTGQNASSASAAPSTSANQLALTYTGGKAGAADPGLAPVTVGWFNQQGGPISFTDATQGAQAAVAYVNKELGGIQGHPLQLDTCFVVTVQDGPMCASQLADNSKVSIVGLGVAIEGDGPLLQALQTKHKAVIMSSFGTLAQMTAPNGAGFVAGLVGLGPGQAVYATQYLHAKNGLYISYQTASTDQTYETMKQYFAKAGASLAAVSVPETATAPQISAALQAGNISHRDVLEVNFQSAACVDVYEALQTIGMATKIPVVANLSCDTNSVAQALNGQFPPWYYVGFGYNVYMPGTPNFPLSYEVPLTVDKIKQYGGPNVDFSEFAPTAFADILTIAKLLNQLGPDASAEQLLMAARNYHSNAWMVLGDADCGSLKSTPAVCIHTVGVQRFDNDRWESVGLDGYSGNGLGLDPFAGS
jgi:branched-chain amino acid transport system substrate-binding protein